MSPDEFQPSLAERVPLEQRKLIERIGQQWTDRATQPIDRDRASIIVAAIYGHLGIEPPQIRFVTSPAAEQVLNFGQRRIDRSMRFLLEMWLSHTSWSTVETSLHLSLANSLKQACRNTLQMLLMQRMRRVLENALGYRLQYGQLNCLRNEFECAWAACFEFGRAIGVEMNPEHYALYMSYCKELGCIFPYDDLVIVCDRPQHIRWDTHGKIHAEGEPAMQFADGFGLWAWHGTSLPAKYHLHPQHWQAQWFLEESNAELRRVLIEGIGYDRLIQELGALELDRWREYTLLKIDAEIEPVCLLQMCCPSTDHLYVLRVPPQMRSAREAIGWCNWGIDPDEFAAAS